MKRLFWLLIVLVCTVRSANAQQGLQAYVVTGTGVQARIVLTGSAIVIHQLTWNVTGTVSSCTVALDTSADGISWSAGNAIAGQTCTSNGQSALSTSVVFNFVRVNTTAFSGTGSVVVTWAGYVASPGGLPTGCTPGPTNGFTCTGNVLGANLPAALPSTPNGVSFIDTSTPAGGVAVPPVWSRAGVNVRAMVATSDTVLVSDLGNIIKTTSALAITETVPDGGTAPFTNPSNFGIYVSGFGDVTLTRTATSQFCAGAFVTCVNTFIVSSGQFAYVYLDANNNWNVSVQLSSNPGGSQIITGQGTTGIPLTIISAPSTANYALRVLDSSLTAVMRVDPETNGAASFYGVGGSNGVVNLGTTSAPTFYRIDPTANLTTTTGEFAASIVQSTVGTQTVSAADYTNTTTTPSTIFSWLLPVMNAAKTYRYSCDITWESTAATLVGLVLGVNLSAAPTQLTATAVIQNTLAGADTIGYISNTTTGHQNVLSGGAAGVTSTNYWARIYGTIEGAAAAGSTFIIDGASTSNTTANVVVRRGSACYLN